jgi:hypothetical protein
VTSLLFYFSSANLLSFSLSVLILWEFFSKTQSGSGFYAEIFVTLLNVFMQENKFLKFLGFMWNPCHGLWKLPHSCHGLWKLSHSCHGLWKLPH